MKRQPYLNWSSVVTNNISIHMHISRVLCAIIFFWGLGVRYILHIGIHTFYHQLRKISFGALSKREVALLGNFGGIYYEVPTLY